MDRPLEAKIKRTWPATNFGRRSLFHDFVRFSLVGGNHGVLLTLADDSGPVQEGAISKIEPEKVPADAPPLAIDGFEWVTIDVNDAKEVSNGMTVPYDMESFGQSHANCSQ